MIFYQKRCVVYDHQHLSSSYLVVLILLPLPLDCFLSTFLYFRLAGCLCVRSRKEPCLCHQDCCLNFLCDVRKIMNNLYASSYCSSHEFHIIIGIFMKIKFVRWDMKYGRERVIWYEHVQ